MNIVSKLVFLAVVLGVIALSVGCQQPQPGLSQEEVRSIVREEVTRQLAGTQARDIVEEEVARQLSSVDELSVSKLFIVDEDRNIVASLDSMGGAGVLSLNNADGQIHTMLHSVGGEGVLSIGSGEGHTAVLLASQLGSGIVYLSNANGDAVVLLGQYVSDDGIITIKDKDGQVTFEAP